MNTKERSPNAMVSETLSGPHVFAPTSERAQGLSRQPDQWQLDRELKVRLEERSKERRRIARDLHDTLLQGFLGASLLLQGAVDQTPADSPAKPSLSRALRLMYRVINEGRVTLQELRLSPSASPSLEEALHGVWDELTPGGVQFRILVEGQPKSLKPAIQEQIYLIGREAVLNAVRHSGAGAIEVEVEYSPRRLRMVVRDNGCGIDPQTLRSGRDLHWGLQGMRERAGGVGAQLRIWSRIGAGTEVEISAPIHIVADDHAQLSMANIESSDQPGWRDACTSRM
jgi:signal transduction histidine kinase